jgi:cytochrome c biogenesis protein CcmG/thiol:disulfide interchange protein DsbE
MSFNELPPAESLDAPAVNGVGAVSAATLPSVEALDASATEADTSSSKSKTGLFVFIAIAVTAIAIFGFAFAPSRASVAVSVDKANLIADPTGMSAPNFSGNLLDGSGKGGLGGSSGLGGGAAKAYVVNFWASWCGPCKAEGSVLAAAEKKWRDQGVVFIGVNSRDTTEPARAFEKSYGITYASVVDPNAEIGKHYYVTGFPETYFVSKSGKVVTKFVSSIDAGTLDSDIQAALNAS